jgi:hypothetical protein
MQRTGEQKGMDIKQNPRFLKIENEFLKRRSFLFQNEFSSLFFACNLIMLVKIIENLEAC